MSCWALIPIKTLSLGKGRLAGALSPAERQRLIRKMLDRVLAALTASRLVEGIAIVTPECRALAGKATLLPDRGAGLNGSIADAAQSLAAFGATELLVLHGDLPLVNRVEIDRIITLGRSTGLALAPDRRRQGTNAIYLQPDSGFEFRFGTHSFASHQAEAARCGLRPTVVDLPGLAFDVDEAPDLDLLGDLLVDLREGAKMSPQVSTQMRTQDFPINSRSVPIWQPVQPEYSLMHARD
ncbi:2-phospho-L-lactate guanylyltransferase [Aromatoleum anaerobium]|uniref:3-phospho-D-glycerate guanylyltransferase n=1 Tax=Aromatoleum anaerobium TaxID=182180 RepID=A0ABX1PP59_9RHOO|nr:2-phospho-L-lactate guanylyltransferase [Aromatoleum anaerobium]MCK0508181.1 2-phospho-L-lactate guanylyltransferase [Aromatoleum anaerobium]